MSPLTRDSLDLPAWSHRMAEGPQSKLATQSRTSVAEATEQWEAGERRIDGGGKVGGDVPGTDLEKQQVTVLRRPNAQT